MKHGFLILTHLPPEKIYNLIAKIKSPDNYFFIHFDKKLSIDNEDPFYKKLTADGHVTLLKQRLNIQWGGSKITDATLLLIKEGLAHSDISYFHLMSGECLPVKSKAYIDQYFSRNNGKEFLHHFLMPHSSNEHGLTYQRIDKFHLHDFFNPKSQRPADKILKTLNTALRKLQRLVKPIGIYRRYPTRFPTLYAGSQWWSLSYAACKYISDYIEQNKQFHNRFRYTQAIDEVFFHTIIMNSPFKDNVVNNNLRFINFKDSISSPKPLTMENLPDINKPDVLFARKFTAESKELEEYLDKHVY